jgi:glycosyltransferase involved in cell wall biosynthesis
VPKATVLYHYFHPDDVVSARHFSDLCEDLAARGWDVEAMPCNRGCRDESRVYARVERWRGVSIRRVWRPPFTQASSAGRMLNAAWMIARWSAIALRRESDRPDVVLVGTDPVLGVLLASVVRRLRPRIKLAHWAFDLYPEAPIAEGMLRADGPLVRLLERALADAYGACDLIADLGACMRERIERYGGGAQRLTLVPWALVEPPEPPNVDAATRAELFGDARLGLLYSGNFGRAHSFEAVLALARALRRDGVRLCFAVRGNRADELRRKVGAEDTNVSFADFAPEAELERRLGAADVHVASLREDWTGLVVPSKFFGSLASGRPVVFAGSSRSGIARWIHEHQVGWALDERSVNDVANELRSLAGDAPRLAALQHRCFETYRANFSRARVTARWDAELRALVDPRPDAVRTAAGVAAPIAV